MIVPPKKVAHEFAAMIKQVVADIEKMLPAGEKISVAFRFADCVPFNIEIENKKTPARAEEDEEHALGQSRED